MALASRTHSFRSATALAAQDLIHLGNARRALRPARGLGDLSTLGPRLLRCRPAVLPVGLASRVGETVSFRDRLGLVRPTQTTAGLMLA